MEVYHSIEHFSDKSSLFGQKIMAFNKYDGSNFRVEWNYRLRNSIQKGFTNFGTRTQQITEKTPHYGEAVKIFLEKYAEPLCESLSDRKKRSPFNGVDKVTAFFEFFGQNSFAGFHNQTDEKDLVLFDVLLDKIGFLPPNEFQEIFSKQWYLHSAELIFQGILTKEFSETIKTNVWNLPVAKYPQVKEGVVCKQISAPIGHKLEMTKIKTEWWIKELKSRHPSNYENLL